MDALLKAEWLDVITISGVVAVGFYVGTECTKIVWVWLHGMLSAMIEKMKPKD